MKSLLSPLALLAALVMTLSGCARTIPPPTSAESASPSAPTVETSDEKPDKLPDDSQSESTAQLTEAAASPQLCAYLPVSSLPEDAAAALEPYRQSISSLDYLILNTGVYWAADGTLEVHCPPDLLAKLPEDQRGALLGILAQDPRPHYQKDPDRVYGMAFGQWNVKFRITEGIVYVISLENA